MSKASSKILTIGLSKDKDYFTENLSMLINSGMPILEALEGIKEEIRSKRLKKIIDTIKNEIEDGSSAWKAFNNSGLFKDHAIALIKLGEESGTLADNIKTIATDEQKDREFRSKLKSAVMYPVFVLGLTGIIGVGISWFILPRLATVFSQLKVDLPLVTKLLINFGEFLRTNGHWVMPLAIAITFVLAYIIFFLPKTKIIGQTILLKLPGIKRLIKEIEIARFGYLLGTLLNAGLPINQALQSIAGATEFAKYKKLYLHLQSSIENGSSFQKSFLSAKKLSKVFPASIRQLISSAEKSGKLSEALIKVGENFEAKANITTKNLAVILEPILLLIVWLGVIAVALAVILPIYGLVGGLNV